MLIAVRRALAGALALALCALLVVATAGSTLLPGLASKYYLLLPGAVYPVAAAIQLPEERRRETGELYYAIVFEAVASLPEALVAAGRPGVRVVRYEAIIPTGTSVEESNRVSRRLMSESQTAAAVVALRQAGYSVRVGGDGVRIMELIPGRPAAELLRVGDIVVSQDGHPVGTATDLIQAVRQRSPGDELELTIRRDGAEMVVRIRTAPTPGEPGRPSVGARVQTEGFQADLPFPVTISSGEVVGPSAGLMFALGIYDAVTPGRLAEGRKVAGTGTIGLDGQVGAVEGAAQKVLGAERAGATVFLAPSENAAEARAAAGAIRVVPVASFADALAALQTLD